MNLRVSETFLSFQGEGSTVGVPAVFLRMGGCMLNCTFCDTTEVWKRWEHFTVAHLVQHFHSSGYFAAMSRGAHLIVTGGDPMLQQVGLADFLTECETELVNLVVEVETEGLIRPIDDFDNFVWQYNVSPKLANSGMPYEKRVNLKVLQEHMSSRNSIFKFPVKSEACFQEIEQLLEHLEDVDTDKLYVMPICSTRAEQDAMAPVVAQLAMQYSFRYSPRLHLQIWDKAVGV